MRVSGVEIDAQTRCIHYQSPVDVVAIRLRCCPVFYSCFECHEALSDHPAEQWPLAEFSERAVLCGVCQQTLSITEYLGCEDACPRCGAEFNPGCKNHRHLYFAEEVEGSYTPMGAKSFDRA